jgi:hypothetical protein
VLVSNTLRTLAMGVASRAPKSPQSTPCTHHMRAIAFATIVRGDWMVPGAPP